MPSKVRKNALDSLREYKKFKEDLDDYTDSLETLFVDLEDMDISYQAMSDIAERTLGVLTAFRKVYEEAPEDAQEALDEAGVDELLSDLLNI